MNILGKLGDPEQVAAALSPLIDKAEDKALAELHASLTLAVTALQQDVAQAISTVQREIQDTRIVLVEQLSALTLALDKIVKDAIEEIQKTTIVLGRKE